MDLTPETDYSAQVCQALLNTCGNCMVDFRTLAIQGKYVLAIWLRVHNYMHNMHILCILCKEVDVAHTL